MSVLLTASKKAVQSKLLAKKIKEKKAKSASAKARKAPIEPPVSSSATMVWYWTLDSVPTSLLFNKVNNEVWCNGYILETTETFGDYFAPGGVISFGIYLYELDTIHEGRICRLLAAGDNPQGYVYQLYVDGCLVPEHISSGVSAIMTTTMMTHQTAAGEPPRYDDVVKYDDNLPVIFDSMKLKKDN